MVNAILWRTRAGAPWRDLPEVYGSNDKDSPPDQVDRRRRKALGRSRGELTTKIHLAADQRCRPSAVVTREGQRYDSVAFETVLERLVVDRVGWSPRTRPDCVLADKGLSSKQNRAYLTGRKIKAAIRSRTTRSRLADVKGAPVAGHPRSTRSATATATLLSVPSTSSAKPER